MRATLAGSLFFITACGSGPLIEIVPTWPKDQVAILLLTGSDGKPIGSTPAVLAGDVWKLELDTKDQLRARVLSFPQVGAGGPDFERCGLAIRGEGSPLPRPERYFVSDPIATTDGSSVTLAEAPAMDADALELTFAAKTCRFTYPCEDVLVFHIASPIATVHAQTAIAVDEHTVLIEMVGDPTQAAKVLALADRTSATVILDEPTLPQPLSMAFDGTQMWSTIYAGKAFTFTLDGTVTSTRAAAGRAGAYRVASDRHGTVIAFGDNGVHVMAGVDDPEKRAAIESLTDETGLVALTSQDRMLANTKAGLYTFDGNVWTLEREMRPSAFEGFQSLSLEADTAGAAGKDSEVIVRDEASHAWTVLPLIDPDTYSELKSIVSLGGGRWMTVGESGLAAIYQQGVWCTFNTGTTNTLDTIALTPNRHTAYVGGHYSPMTNNVPELMRVDLPE